MNRHLLYDYLLVVGPGRSGSEFLYENLKSHPHLAFPEIKEGYYYRSLSAFKKVRSQLDGGQEKILVDIANLGYSDPALTKGIKRLQDDSYRILLVALLRNHRDRAVSMIRFRKSRGEISALFGARRLENAVVRDRLTPKNLSAMYDLEVDLLTIHFPALITHTATVLDILCSLCGTSKLDSVQQRIVNEAVRARYPLLSAFGKSIAVVLRKSERRHLLQRLKDNRFVKKLFFVPLSDDKDNLSLSEESTKILEDSFLACRSIIENSAEHMGENCYFRKAGSSLKLKNVKCV